MRKVHLLLSAALLLVAARAFAQAPIAPGSSAEIGSRMPASDIEVLISPIALYPDPLVALILPASTNPSEVVLAARFLERGGSVDAAGNEAWSDAVKALLRYREVIAYLDENLEWTQRLGDVFVNQPDDVMAAIQTVRARAKNAGLLTSNAQQEVIIEETIIEIVPAQPTVIYVPRYDPEILYVSRPSYFHTSFLSFGIGYSVGSWLNYDCDWRHRSVHVVHRPSSWYYQPNWHHRHIHHNHSHRHNHVWTRWTPPVRHHRYDGHAHRPYRPVQTYMPRANRDWNRDHQRHQQNTSVAAARSEGSQTWQNDRANRPQADGDRRTHRTYSQNSDATGRRFERGQRSPSTVNSFAATPTPPPAAAAPVPTPTPAPRFDRRERSEERRDYGNRQPNATRPNYRQQNPAVATQSPQMPRQRAVDQPRQRQVQQPRPAEQPRQFNAPARSNPPPQRAVAQTAPTPPRASQEAPRSARNESRGSRSDSTERSPSVRHAY